MLSSAAWWQSPRDDGRTPSCFSAGCESAVEVDGGEGGDEDEREREEVEREARRGAAHRRSGWVVSVRPRNLTQGVEAQEKGQKSAQYRWEVIYNRAVRGEGVAARAGVRPDDRSWQERGMGARLQAQSRTKHSSRGS